MHNIFPNKIASTLIIFLTIFSIVLLSAYVSRGRVLEKAQNEIATIEHSKNILFFQKLFVDKVLKSDGVVDYDVRRELEQAVGRTNDEAVIAAWNAFISAKNEKEGQDKVKELLSVIANRAY